MPAAKRRNSRTTPSTRHHAIRTWNEGGMLVYASGSMGLEGSRRRRRVGRERSLGRIVGRARRRPLTSLRVSRPGESRASLLQYQQKHHPQIRAIKEMLLLKGSRKTSEEGEGRKERANSLSLGFDTRLARKEVVQALDLPPPTRLATRYRARFLPPSEETSSRIKERGEQRREKSVQRWVSSRRWTSSHSFVLVEDTHFFPFGLLPSRASF